MSGSPIRRVALLTAGGYAPCLSAAVGGLIERYSEVLPEAEIVGYLHGYHGLLTGNKLVVDQAARDNAQVLLRFGGSPIAVSYTHLDVYKRQPQGCERCSRRSVPAAPLPVC